MPSREHEPLLRTSYFRVLIGEHELGFSEVGRVTSRTDLEREPREQRHHFDTVVLRRAITDSAELYEWRRQIVDGEDARREVTIDQLHAPGGEVVNSWRLVGAWPCRWSGPAFNALESDIAYEELELAFDDVVWLQDNRTIQGG
jgi:phage tail-like protein